MLDLYSRNKLDSERHQRLVKFTGVGYIKYFDIDYIKQVAKAILKDDLEEVREWTKRIIIYKCQCSEGCKNTKCVRIAEWLIDTYVTNRVKHTRSELCFLFMTQLNDNLKLIIGVPEYEFEEDIIAEMVLFFTKRYNGIKNGEIEEDIEEDIEDEIE